MNSFPALPSIHALHKIMNPLEAELELDDEYRKALEYKKICAPIFEMVERDFIDQYFDGNSKEYMSYLKRYDRRNK